MGQWGAKSKERGGFIGATGASWLEQLDGGEETGGTQPWSGVLG